jgi:adenylate kinase
MASKNGRMRPLVFLGPPGAGKGTQARVVAERLSVPQISTGDMFREHVGQGTELGRKAKSIMEKGDLVPDDIVIAMVAERIQQPDCAGGFLLDGFPRTVPQAEQLERLLASQGWPGALAVNFIVSYNDLFRRLTGRRTCSVCGEIYNIYFRPPKVEGRCDRDGGELRQRADDREEAIRTRLEKYEQETQPLVEFYRRRGALLDFAAEGAPEQLTSRLLGQLEAAMAGAAGQR